MVRVELDNGRRLVGLRYPEPLITEVSELIKQQKLNAFAVGIYFALKIIYSNIEFLLLIAKLAISHTARIQS